ncbi:alpha/beta fold hydrolase [Pseudostreptobacillus hongkongensis]|uniref:alpha/beta hydrolase n=1 Tax=Pseudostreptobacillus hongkongensis TaxID=1162717 RepID=UPI0028D88C61|nr:alpha/beta fold hydrolase [Pseudostreptobacillus hongkongensis]
MFSITQMYIDKIEKYPKETLEDSLKFVMKSKNRFICGKYSPAVFDMPFYEIDFKSDGLNLYGWYLPVEGAQKTMVISHGRKNNRIFTLKFLQLFKDMQLNEKYNIFLPDLRNSGKSDEARTAFGYYFSRDIKNAVLMLNEKYGTKDFVLYGFSQGGMGSAIVPYMYKEELRNKEITIEKLILDSPVSNVKKLLDEYSTIGGVRLPYIFTEYVQKIFNGRIDNKLYDLKLSKLLGIVPTLILQSEKDVVTPYNMIKEEYEIIKEKSKNDNNIIKPEFKAFRKGQHVRIYLQYKWEYTSTIQNFLNY